MPTASHEIGDSFPIQFAWRLPDGDYIRAIFQAEVLDMISAADKYVVRLNKLIAGRQESEEGEMRPTEAYTRDYWNLVGQISGNKISVAYEAEDGRALYLRLATLTGEHNYFHRFSDAEAMIRRRLASTDDPSP